MIVSRSLLASSLFLASCGATAPEQQGPPPGPPPPVGPPRPPPLQVQGQLGGNPFVAVAAALMYREQGWTLVVSDHHPDDAGELPVQATDVSLVIGRGADLPAETTQTGTTMYASITRAAESIGGDRILVSDSVADFQVQLAEIQRGPDDPEQDYPQVVGRTRARFRASFRTEDGSPIGQLEGDVGVIPIIFAMPPEDACRTQTPAPTGVTWTDAPTSRSIPAAPLAGSARGHGFTPVAVRFLQTNDGRWRLEIADRPYQQPTDGMPHGQYLMIDLESAPRSRARITRRIGAGGGYWQVCDGLGTTSWNADNAYYLEITSWNVTPPPPGMPQVGQRMAIGTASGRVFVSYRGFEPTDNSWAAGTFTDVPVVVEALREPPR